MRYVGQVCCKYDKSCSYPDNCPFTKQEEASGEVAGEPGSHEIVGLVLTVEPEQKSGYSGSLSEKEYPGESSSLQGLLQVAFFGRS